MSQYIAARHANDERLSLVYSDIRSSGKDATASKGGRLIGMLGAIIFFSARLKLHNAQAGPGVLCKRLSSASTKKQLIPEYQSMDEGKAIPRSGMYRPRYKNLLFPCHCAAAFLSSSRTSTSCFGLTWLVPRLPVKISSNVESLDFDPSCFCIGIIARLRGGCSGPSATWITECNRAFYYIDRQ